MRKQTFIEWFFTEPKLYLSLLIALIVFGAGVTSCLWSPGNCLNPFSSDRETSVFAAVYLTITLYAVLGSMWLIRDGYKKQK